MRHATTLVIASGDIAQHDVCHLDGTQIDYCSEHAIRELDHYECVASGHYRRRTVEVETVDTRRSQRKDKNVMHEHAFEDEPRLLTSKQAA